MRKLTVESALRIVATESDIRIYKLLDSHINELEAQLKEARAEVERLDKLERAERSERHALEAQNQRMREALERIENYSYPGFSLGAIVKAINEMRDIAQSALNKERTEGGG